MEERGISNPIRKWPEMAVATAAAVVAAVPFAVENTLKLSIFEVHVPLYACEYRIDHCG